MPRDESDTRRKVLGVGLRRDTIDALYQLGEPCGMSAARTAAALLEELAPKVEAIQPRRGVAIKLKAEKPNPATLRR